MKKQEQLNRLAADAYAASLKASDDYLAYIEATDLVSTPKTVETIGAVLLERDRLASVAWNAAALAHTTAWEAARDIKWTRKG